MILSVIAFFFPALFSIVIKHTRNKGHAEQKHIWAEYGIYVLVNVCLTTMIIIRGWQTDDLTVKDMENFSFFLSYTTIAIIVAIIVPYIEEIIRKYIKVTFTVREKDKN